MIAPSPDWFVGVTRLDLRNGDTWVPQLTVDLFGYDAGTDSGINFTSPNADSFPQNPITVLGAPLPSVPALGTLTFTLLGDFNYDGIVDGADFLKWQRGESPSPLSQSDLDDWQNNVANVASPITAASTTVPEPATGIMLLIGMAILLTGGRTVVPKFNPA
jgi:hypothetical protein